MKKHLNTLFITTQGSYLSKDGECVSIKVDGELKGRIPIHTIGGIVCFGRVSTSPYLLGLCSGARVTVTYLTLNGRFLARVLGPTTGNVLLRKEQYRRSESAAQSTEIARSVLLGKVANCRTLLQRAQRDHGEADQLRSSVDRLYTCIERLQRKDLSLDSLRGIEGEAAAEYFRVFNDLIRRDERSFEFRGRTRRPPKDIVNCMLSFVYTLLVHDIRSALETVGLDPAVGFLHRDRPGRPSLALDILEEFRPAFADRIVLSMINRGQVKASGFVCSETGAFSMKEDTRKAVILAYQERKQETIQHPFLKERMPIGLLWHTQALLFARFLRGDLDGYPPYVIR